MFETGSSTKTQDDTEETQNVQDVQQRHVTEQTDYTIPWENQRVLPSNRLNSMAEFDGYRALWRQEPRGRCELIQARISISEVVILATFLTVWIITIAAFIYKWRHLRLIEPCEHSFRHKKPKNMDSIRIVKKQADSVIYNLYSEPMTRNMQLREKRLQSMHTMSAIKLSPSPSAQRINKENKDEKNTQCTSPLSGLGYTTRLTIY